MSIDADTNEVNDIKSKLEATYKVNDLYKCIVLNVNQATDFCNVQLVNHVSDRIDSILKLYR